MSISTRLVIRVIGITFLSMLVLSLAMFFAATTYDCLRRAVASSGFEFFIAFAVGCLQLCGVCLCLGGGVFGVWVIVDETKPEPLA